MFGGFQMGYGTYSERQTVPVEEATEAITLFRIFELRQPIILRLRDPNIRIPTEESSYRSICVNKIKQLLSNITLGSGNVEEKNNPHLLKKNLKKIDKVFDGISVALNQQREHAKDELKKMSPEQQKEFLAFLEEFSMFFIELFDMLREFTRAVVAFIKQGGKLDVGMLDEIFNDILHKIQELFGKF